MQIATICIHPKSVRQAGSCWQYWGDSHQGVLNYVRRARTPSASLYRKWYCHADPEPAGTPNSLSMAMLEGLSSALEKIARDDSSRVVVLASAGHVFCAGHDLREMRDKFDSHEFQLALFQQCSKVMQQIVNLPKPVIARVAGVATAAGCQLVASCDLAVAERGSRFATPGVNIGLFCSTPMVALSRNVSRKH